MTRLLTFIGVLVLLKGGLLMLSGCGVEGPPQAAGAVQGVAVSGEASLGVVGSF